MINPRRAAGMQRLGLLLGATLLTGLVACIQLDGQRIAWFHDVERDELRILLFYDGIHDDGRRSSLHRMVDGAEQVRRFVEQDEVMLLDWMGHVRTQTLQQRLADADDPPSPAERRFLEAALAVQVEVLGRYRSPDGKLGAAQRVTIPGVSGFLEALNACLDELVLEHAGEVFAGQLERTDEAWVAAARDGHRWLRLDGHALRLTVPVHADEWTLLKRLGLWIGLRRLAEEVLEVGSVEALDAVFRRAAASFGSLPFSLADGGDELTLLVGRRDEPLQFTALLRDEYEPNVEEAVQAAVPVELGVVLAEHALRRAPDPRAVSAPPAGALDDVLAWGHPEVRVWALALRAAPPEGGPLDEAAWAELEAFAEAWNAAGRLPAAPRLDQETVTTWPRDVRNAWGGWSLGRRGDDISW